MNRIETPRQALNIYHKIYCDDLDALMPELAEVLVSRPDIREAILEEQRRIYGEHGHPDYTNPRYNPEILDYIEQLQQKLAEHPAEKREEVLAHMAREDLALAEILIVDSMIVKQILNQDTI